MTKDETHVSRLSQYGQALIKADPLQEPIVRSALELLQLPAGSKGFDAGCGVGLQVLSLARAVGPGGHVTGLDLSTEFVAYAGKLAAEAGLSERVDFRQGDVNHLPFEDNAFDWAWSMSCVGYNPMDPLPALREMARVVKPGGTVAIAAWSSEQLLPGYPLLEARLNATGAGIAPFKAGMNPERHFLRAAGWFSKVGLENAKVHTLVGEVVAPLSDGMRLALTELFDMRWGSAQSEITAEDWQAFQRLCRPESEDFILRLPDYYAFYTYSLFSGKVTG